MEGVVKKGKLSGGMINAKVNNHLNKSSLYLVDNKTRNKHENK